MLHKNAPAGQVGAFEKEKKDCITSGLPLSTTQGAEWILGEYKALPEASRVLFMIKEHFYVLIAKYAIIIAAVTKKASASWVEDFEWQRVRSHQILLIHEFCMNNAVVLVALCGLVIG